VIKVTNIEPTSVKRENYDADDIKTVEDTGAEERITSLAAVRLLRQANGEIFLD
jgi:hypothetical protein